jgi:hypothetical protein
MQQFKTLPQSFAIGETLTWSRKIECYSPADGWALVYSFRGAAHGFDVTATQDPTDATIFDLTVQTGGISGIAEGQYYWQAWVSKAGEKHLVGDGRVSIKAALDALTSSVTFDGRSEAKKMVDLIDSILSDPQQLRQKMYTIGSRTIEWTSKQDLLNVRSFYSRKYSAELRRDRIRKGGSMLKTIRTRFRRPR